MGGEDKIKYSDLISPDDSIKALIAQLTELNRTYGTVLEVVKSGAKDIVSQLKSMSSATSAGRAEIDEAAISANRLAKAEKDLAFSMSETGKQVAWLKSQTASQNKMSVENRKWSEALIGSYDRLKFQVKDLTKRYKELSTAEREGEKGSRILGQLQDKKKKIAELDAQMKLHVETLSAVEKAEKKLAFLRSEEGQRLLELKRLINEEVAAHRTERESIDEVSEAMNRLKAAQSGRRVLAHQYNIEAKEQNKIAKLQAQMLISEEGSYNKLAAQYELNKIKLNAMSAAERQAVDVGKKLEAETQALYTQMTKLQEAVGNHRLSVGHYAKSWDGLGISVSQVVRELPAAAVSMNTFFLGISNNIPILVDEINKLREANRRAVAEGKPAKSVIGAITSSLLGWNTVLVVGLTLLSMHGKAIIDWVSTLIRGGKAAMTATELVETLNEELKNNTGALGDNIVSVHKLSREWKSLATKKEQLQWIRDNKSEFDQLDVSVRNVSDAENIFVKHTDTMIAALKLRAKATAAYSAAAKKYEESFIKQQEAEAMTNREASFFENLAGSSLFAGLGILNPSLIGPIAQSGLTKQSGEFIKNTLIKQKREEAKAAEADAKALYKLGDANAELAAKELKRVNIGEAHKYKKDRTRTPRERDLTDAINRMALSVQKKYEQSITDLERNEYDKRRKDAVDAANAKIRELKETYRKNEEYLADEKNRYEELTEDEVKMVQEAQKQIRKTINNTQAQLAYELTQIRKDEQISELRIQEETIRLRLEAVKKGSEEELELKLKTAKISQKIALLENSKKPISQQQNPNDIIVGFGKQETGLKASFEMERFDQQQALDSARFNEVSRSEYELTRFRLEQEKDRWQKQIDLAKEGAIDWSDVQIQEAESIVKGINRELDELEDPLALIGEKGLGGALLTKLGFDDRQIDALDEAVGIVLDNLQAIADAEVEIAEAAVSAAEKRVEAAQSAYEAEIEARNNGYANNVATAKKELQQEKKNQLEKQKLLEQAQKRQEAINTVVQASSLITASANIWSSLSSIPIVGPALALAAIATMWGSFAAAKIKAKQVTATASEEYGEGGLEILEGGSHASGNDIDLATKNSRGKNMRAEGGEALAIINKKQTRKYRKQLPGIVEALNKGTFEDKYVRAFEQGDALQAQLIASQTNIDLSRVEQDVAEIKRQNSVKYYPVGDGSMLMIKGNVKCYIK